MYFNKFLALSAMTTLAAATAVVKRTDGGGSGGGNKGCPAIQCCQSTSKASDPTTAAVLAGAGIVVQDVNTLVGLNCSPITVVGGGNGACSKTTVYCKDNSHNNGVSVSCIPVTL